MRFELCKEEQNIKKTEFFVVMSLATARPVFEAGLAECVYFFSFLKDSALSSDPTVPLNLSIEFVKWREIAVYQS
jgi:hypothetical protein